MVEVRFINDTTPVEVTAEQQETSIGVQSETQETEVNVMGLMHRDLSGRDLPDQHPISAITGLQEALTATAQEIGAIGQTIGSYGDIVTHNVIEFATAAQGALADTAVQPSALIGYATQSWVANQGYLTEIPAEYVTDSELTAKGYQTAEQVELAITSKGYITGITLSDVTTALGYIPYSSSNPSGYITSAALEPYVLSADLSAVATSGSYTDLTDKPTIGNATLTIQKNSTNIDTFSANATENKTINIIVPTTAADVSALPSSTKYGANLTLSINSTTYVVTAQLKDQDGNNLGTAQTVDLPLESVVVSGSYDDTTKKIILTLQSGSTIEFSVADLVSGLQTEITASNKLDADLVTDSTSTNKFVTSSEKSTWNGKQDAINDLSTIRSGARAGATAVQPTDLATVATSGAYNDLTGKPTIPSATSDLLNDSGFITSSALNGYATESWVGQQGYLTSITSANVIAALGYTPYSAANPNGYITNSALAPYALSADLATVATTGSYNDLTNKPTIPAAQVNSDWNATSGVAQILNKPSIPTDTSDLTNGAGYITGITSSDVTTALGYTPYNSSNPSGYITSAALTPYALSANLATVATSGSYSDLSNTPTIPTVNNATITITQGGTTKGTFTLNQSSNATIALDAGGGGGTTYTAGDGIIIENDEISVDGVQTTELSIDTTPTQNSSNLITSGGVYAILGDIESAINTIRGV